MSASTPTYAQGLSATTWFESLDGKEAIKINVNSATAPGIAPNTGFHFSFTP